MIERPVLAQVDAEAERVARMANLAMWFFQALDSVKYVQDPQLRNSIYREVTEAFKIARGARPRVEVQEDDLPEAIRRRT